MWANVVTFALLAVSIIGNVYQWFTKDRTVISDDSIREEIIPVAKLTTYEYNFTQVLYINDTGNPLNITNPLTTKRFVATIDGSIPIQLDGEQIECQSKLHATNNSLVSVKVRIPHSYIGEMTLDYDSFTKYVEDNGFLNLNHVSVDDYTDLEIQTEKGQKRKLEESDAIERADKRAEELIAAQIHNLHGDDVSVTFEYIE